MAIECNPRTHSAVTMFYDHPDLARAYLDGAFRDPAAPGARPTYWLYHELWRLCTQPEARGGACGSSSRGKEAIFDWWRPAAVPAGAPPADPVLLLAATCVRRKGWIRDRLQHRQARRARGGLTARACT